MAYRHHDPVPGEQCLQSSIKVINGVPAAKLNKEKHETIPLGKRVHNLRSTTRTTDGYDHTLDRYLTSGEFSRCNINVGTNEHIRAVATYFVTGTCGGTNDRESISMELDTTSGSLDNEDFCLRSNDRKYAQWQQQNRYFHVSTMDILCVDAQSDCHVKINCVR